MMNFPGANLLLGPFTFLQNESWVFSSTSTLYLYISSVHFKAHRRGELHNANCCNSILKQNFFHYKNTKCTLNFGLKSLEKLRSLDCSSQLPATKKTMMNFPGANLLLGPFTFLQNESWVFSSTSTLYLYISSVHFKAHRRGELRNLRLNFTARRWLFLACTNRQMADG